ncbi:diacylglycerol acyltransferase [Cylindrobasidium torrendii FP15055 ss-10]|uniref:Diacylglycerol O-acyltransferase n=1 Tax=Cylindrobasidium torrendii FP15055 ss-10 TaxID=1314674 RepID=A0A0D7BI48_9AGAR|nr:diacylglycerol acyltransferase [Cylindrobasidium torrendii FP15055 ss-10]
MSTIPTIEFVPSRVPAARRLQTLAVLVWALLMAVTQTLWIFLCSIPALWPILLAYYIWIHYIDRAPARGGRTSKWLRNSKWWRYYADYYPASMRKEADLPPDRPYVFGYHPHGIISMGAMATFATEATGFSKSFPGITPHLLTLASNFKLPIYRDIILALGLCSVSKRSCSNILKGGAGQSITIVIGGAAESLRAHPGTVDLTIRRRLGFIKIAIQHGADLVPVFSFGENDIFEQMPNEEGTTLYKFQKKFQTVFGFTLPFFHGRGILNYNLGLMPFRKPIVAIVGRPIHVKQCDQPDIDEITRIQTLYLTELTRIWDTYKDELASTRKREMQFIE